jgi:aldose 1-epimerase
MTATITELPTETAADGTQIRSFALSASCNVDITVVISTVGAAIHSVHLNGKNIVLGYDTPKQMYETNNPFYLGVIVGRVANRIQSGTFRLNDTSYKLETNNGPNHLHGGVKGFSHAVWDAEIVDAGVVLTMTSPDGDSGYPAGVVVQAKYTLEELPPTNSGARLCLTMTGRLTEDATLSTPINLANHSYFNLSGRDADNGILDHIMELPSTHFTPNDATSIPTREVAPVTGQYSYMNFTSPTRLADALKKWAVQACGLSLDEAELHIRQQAGRDNQGDPYGVDHNYVVRNNVAGSIKCDGRQLTVYTNAPGVQIYTGNWLDRQWQGVCLETQHYPDSIMSQEECKQFPEFSQGKCVILTPGGEEYRHEVEYHFEACRLFDGGT